MSTQTVLTGAGSMLPTAIECNMVPIIKASVTPSVAVPGEDVRYGYKWWLYPYCRDRSRVAWAGSGFGDQLPIVIPEHDLVMVFLGWNILSDKPSLSHEMAIERVLRAVTVPGHAKK